MIEPLNTTAELSDEELKDKSQFLRAVIMIGAFLAFAVAATALLFATGKLS
jgi:hypothetical protein